MSRENTVADAFTDCELVNVDLRGNAKHQSAFASELFSPLPADSSDASGSFSPHIVYQSYFAAIDEELGDFTPGEHLIKTAGNLFFVLNNLRKGFAEPISQVIELVLTEFAGPCSIHGDDLRRKAETSVKLAVKCWFLADFRTDSDGFGNATRRPWNTHHSLSQHINIEIGYSSFFFKSQHDPRRPFFSLRFTLFEMDRRSLIEIKWTSNIVQHLYLEEHETYNYTVYIFYHTALMESIIQDSRVPDKRDSIKDLLRETLDTLDLLMDLRDPRASQWYREIRGRDSPKGQKLQLDLFAGSTRRLNSLHLNHEMKLRKVEHYTYWQDRLLELEKAFNQSKPTTLAGSWRDRDRRDLGSLAAFVAPALSLLVAVIAMLLSITSVVTGPMSVDIGKRANLLANDGKGVAGQANDQIRDGLYKEPDPLEKLTTTTPTTTETQTIVIIVQNACCDCAKCQASGGTKTGAEARVVETPTTEQVTGVTTFTTLITKQR